MVNVRVPASTSNLGSGFDTFGLALQMYLTVKMDVSATDLHIEVSGEGADEIPRNETNLVYLAVKKFFLHVKQPLPALNIALKNDIPLSRGLGSSGAATIAGLACAAKLTGIDTKKESLLSLANELEGHPENAAASLFGGFTINCLENSRPVTKAFPVEPSLTMVALIPDVTISTKAARQILPGSVSHKDAVFNIQRSALLTHAFMSKNYDALSIAMQDKIHQPYRKQLIPGYDSFAGVAVESKAIGVCISGSGSTILAFTADDGTSLQDAWQQKARALNIPAVCRIFKVDNQGVKYF